MLRRSCIAGLGIFTGDEKKKNWRWLYTTRTVKEEYWVSETGEICQNRKTEKLETLDRKCKKIAVFALSGIASD